MLAAHKPIDLSIGSFSDDQLTRVMNGFGVRAFLVLPFYALNDVILDLRRRTETARKVLIETDHGVVFVKELPWYCSSPEHARFQTSLQEALREQSMPIPELARATSGERFVVDGMSGAIFVAHHYTHGRSWTESIGEAHAAGGTLGRLHGASSGIRLQGFPGMDDVFGTAHKITSLLRHGWTREAERDVGALATVLLDTIDHCRRAARAAGYGDTVLPVHGDYNPFNLLYDLDSDVVAGVVDFDNACLDDPAHDIGEIVVRFAWMRYRGLSSAYGAVPDQFCDAQLEAVLGGYLDANEQVGRKALPLLPHVVTAVATELAAIGLLAGYYSIDDIP
ncbi:phosphotransferase [Solwaraspora sp. WMMD406]|uniref:phosphotransferase enzyme family protein n=1 Tax=Solwaraspora sp. WMMD406 TaxID=3016095 RepID=UPI002416439A|nr:phosphotransferase [Solwaraspora sp. WMMD406]MDG4763007.1 phosphotransferase [Solwaraspora sp. WMMD406]